MSSPRNYYLFKKRTSKSFNSSALNVSHIDSSPVSGYYGFVWYFPIIDDIGVDEVIKKVQLFEDFIERNTEIFSSDEIVKNRAFFVDYHQIVNDSIFMSNWNNFKTDFSVNTEYCLNCMSLAMHQTIMLEYEKECQDGEQIEGYCFSLRNIRARICNYESEVQLRDLKTNCYGKLICVRGTVIKAGHRKLQCQYLAFECSNCEGSQIVKQTDGLFTQPVKCATKGCRNQPNFKPLLSSPHSRSINWRTLRIQELSDEAQNENGRIPRTYECELTEDLLNCCVPGDDITVTGIVKCRNSEDFVHNKNNSSVFNFYLHAISVVNNKNQNQSGQIVFNTMDYYAIKKIHEDPLLFRFLVQSLCPSIYGNELIKAGLLLALFGGTSNEHSRSHSHVLMVGDPGIGKSQMLKACTNIAPRGVYVSGKACTTSGLTVTVAKDAGGDYTLQAGALILADQGICCIDEFDKMSSQHECLLEAMEQQHVSIAKAGITCSLPSRTTILAAANPVGGHYNKTKSVADNLKINSAMLSRFDLIFILLDNADEEFDMRLPEHVLELHLGSKYKNNSSRTRSNQSHQSDRETLKDRLQLAQEETIDFLPHPLFRKYIGYAQEYVKPTLTKEAEEVLNKFYLRLREKFSSEDYTPVTIRQLHSLIRLTEARAKAELREEATKADAIDVIEIMRYSMAEILSDENIDSKPRVQRNLKSTSKSQFKTLLNLLQKIANKKENRIFSNDELREFCDEVGIEEDKITSTLETLNLQGFLLNKGQGNYHLVSSNLI